MSTNKPSYTPDQISAVECRHVIYIPPTNGSEDDYHLVKEIIHLKDDTKIPNIRILRNKKIKCMNKKSTLSRTFLIH